tara:strand:- start:2625 stop:3038 length:414 start_codon:yes stop_codon:yes gene_type:complete
MKHWIAFGLLRTIIVVFLILAQKYDESCKGYTWPILVHMISGIFLILYAITFEKLNNIKNANYPLIITAGILVSIVILISYTIIKKAPNAAYIRIFSAMEMVLILIISVYLFSEKITYKIILGFILIISGVGVLTFN